MARGKKKPTRRQRVTKRKSSSRKKKGKVQRGGKNPYYVDVGKGTSRIKGLITSKSVSKEKAKANVARYKREYATYKRNGGGKSYGSWIIDNGYGVRDGAKSCTIM